MKRFLDLLISLLLFSIIASCNLKTEYLEVKSEYPLEVIDSIAVANELSIPDTSYWEKNRFYSQDTLSIDTYIFILDSKPYSHFIVLTKYSGEELYIIDYRRELL